MVDSTGSWVVVVVGDGEGEVVVSEGLVVGDDDGEGDVVSVVVSEDVSSGLGDVVGEVSLVSSVGDSVGLSVGLSVGEGDGEVVDDSVVPLTGGAEPRIAVISVLNSSSRVAMSEREYDVMDVANSVNRVHTSPSAKSCWSSGVSPTDSTSWLAMAAVMHW